MAFHRLTTGDAYTLFGIGCTNGIPTTFGSVEGMIAPLVVSYGNPRETSDNRFLFLALQQYNSPFPPFIVE